MSAHRRHPVTTAPPRPRRRSQAQLVSLFLKSVYLSLSISALAAARRLTGATAKPSPRTPPSGVQKAGSSKKYERSGNEQFTSELSKWVFHERGHLKALNVRHHKVGETDEPAMYRINDDLKYAVDIYEWSGTRWESYAANDFQEAHNLAKFVSQPD
ncbi:hypothetical protein RJ640_029316 [Escallonia rubra]|uniref:OST48 middle domain-containing protein n=1 Tax=Escallonia rubra TaxID=112253 RepID=A0AA88QYZ9_9ASTE|nr:hypothetical protein RJ640_029316 [Escallonia rubra]